MIAAKDNLPRFTPEEYFAWEEKQLEKHEYIDIDLSCPIEQVYRNLVLNPREDAFPGT